MLIRSTPYFQTVLRGALTFLVALVVLGVTAGSAVGHRSPVTCTQSGVSFDLFGLFATRNGHEVSVTPSVGNNQVAGACDVSDATVTLAFPKADGSDGTQEITVVTGLDMAAGDPLTSYAPVDHTVMFNPGVFRGWTWIRISGDVHTSASHAPSTFPFQGLGVPLYITRPHISLTVTPEVTPGTPATVTYTYTAENDSPADPEPGAAEPFAIGVELTDDKCASPSLTGGDTNGNTFIDHGETWTYTCTTNVLPGSMLNNVVLTGISSADALPWPTTRARGGVCAGVAATLVGTDGKNRLTGTGAADVIVTGAGNDVVNARGGKDLVCGGNGNDTLRGEGGSDTLRGEAGDDTLVGGSGTDTLLGGPGRDTTIQ